MKKRFVVKVRQGAGAEIVGEFCEECEAEEFIGLVMGNFENVAIMVAVDKEEQE